MLFVPVLPLTAVGSTENLDSRYTRNDAVRSAIVSTN